MPVRGALAGSDVSRLSGSVDHFRRLVSPNLDLGPEGVAFKNTGGGNGGWARPPEGPGKPGVVGISASSPPHVIVHELTHQLECANNGTLAVEANKFFLSRLSPGEKLVNSGKGYKTFRDKFAEKNKGVFWMEMIEASGSPDTKGSQYPGRWYGGWGAEDEFRPDKTKNPRTDTPVAWGAREVITTGVEAVYENGGLFAETDPEYFDWVVETVIRRGMD